MGAYLAQYWNDYGVLLLEGTWDTIVMTAVSVLVAYLVGIPLGILLVLTDKNGLHPNRPVNAILGWIVNITRSIPFVILLVALIPFTRIIVGTSLGVRGAIVPLTIAAIPFVARMIEQSVTDIDGSLIEAGQSFGANTWQIVTKVYLKESLPSLIRGAAIAFITIFGYTAMAGTVGAGGLGDIAVRYGYQRHKYDVMVGAVILCIVLIQIVQSIGDFVARKVDKRTLR